MEQYYSKKSSIRDNAVVYEALDRGHQSDITRIKKPSKTSNMSGRRMFTFVGSSGKARTANAPMPTPSKPATPKPRTPHSKRIHRSRSRSTLKNKLLSSLQKSPIKKERSRSASQSSHRETVAANPPKSKPVTPIPVEIAAPPQEAISPAVLVEELPKVETKEEPISPVIPSVSSSDEDVEDEEISTSPSIIGYRKLVYNECDGKWVEYWKLEEDIKRAQKKAKTQKLFEKWKAHKIKPKIHPVKGRITAKMQVMFPTAIVKQDRRHGQYYQSILMTDPLRIELYKRRAPIVPTYFQEHIVKYGKLPFRNNPRPHPVV